MDYKGIDYLRGLLKDKQTRVERCYKYYKQKDKMDNSQAITENKEMQRITKKVGWIQKAVDSLTNRLQFSSFGNDDELMVNDIFIRNNRDVLFNTMFKGAIISSCDFVYISQNTDGTARLQVIDGYNGLLVDLDCIDYDTVVTRMIEFNQVLKDNLKDFVYEPEVDKWLEVLK